MVSAMAEPDRLALPRFPTAPWWYRPVLSAEWVAFLGLFWNQRRRAAQEGLWMQEGGRMNMRYVPIRGTLVGERSIPGQVPAWNMSTHAARYLWAMRRLEHCRVVDLGCG